MLKRISEICGVGNFYNFKNGGKCQFEKLTLIYGLNTYGKSTIVDILRSLQINNPSTIIERKSINGNSDQIVKLNISDLNSTSETTVVFKNGKWQNNYRNYDMLIFDNKFIADNVFSGFEISRENKVNMTDLILGERNVKVAEKIAESKKYKREINNKIKDIEKTIQQQLPQNTNLKDFIFLKIEDVDPQYKEKLIELKKKMSDKLYNSEKIMMISTINKFINNEQIIGCFEKMNELLQTTYEDINILVYEKIKQHIKDNIREDSQNSAEEWINEGLNYLKHDFCPFCGQDINQIELIKYYQKYFNEATKSYANYISENFKKYQENILFIVDKIEQDKSRLAKVIINMKDFSTLLDNQLYSLNLTNLESHLGEYERVVNNYIEFVKEKLNNYIKKIKLKKINPYKPIEPLDINDLIEKQILLSNITLKLNNYIQTINEIVDAEKNKIKNIEEIRREISILDKKIKDEDLKLLRKQLDGICREYITYKQQSDELTDKINKMQNRLKNDNEKYLSKYFEKINNYFKKFGSKDFQLEKTISTQGDKPVVSLKVKFKGKEVNEKQFKTIFSESDRRALALSIFWSQLEFKSSEELLKTIVILDDPVTSFDNNRIQTVIKEIFTMYNRCRQILVFTHYENFMKMILDYENGNCEYNIIKIEKTSTSYLCLSNKDEFILDKHDKTLLKISDFISGNNNDDISKDLRVYFENEIRRRFKYQIIKLNIEKKKVKDIVLQLREESVINEEMKSEILNYLRMLNPEHHIYTDITSDEWRRNAEEILNFIFTKLRAENNVVV